MKKLAVFASSLLLLACASAPTTQVMNQAEFNQLVKAANMSIKKAKSVGGEWSNSKNILDQAELIAKTGDIKKAEKLANQAKEQGEMGYQQAIDQANAGPWLF